MRKPLRIWWARPRKLCVLERPGGGGRSHRPERREAEIAYLKDAGVRLVVSTMDTRHNLPAYDAAGLDWRHVPVAEDPVETLDELLALLKRQLRRRGAVALHGNRHTDFVAAVAAAYVYEEHEANLVEALREAAEAGLTVSADSCALLGVDYAAVQPRSRMAASTSSGRSVTT